MEKSIYIAVILALAFRLILGSIGSATLAHAQQQANTTGGVNMTGKPTGPGAAIPGNVTNPTNATSSPSAVGRGNSQVQVQLRQQIKQQPINLVSS